ncbi:glycosyltransferase family 2 protein [Bdellovibrio sp. HCB290]|uniref:glycosyltransferase family 2 protein n=1 Tax=Bdellovibrio sp. HCB290 TaxID=3394356 RepID=UPI0039B674C9
MSKDLSVVMPVYNEEECISQVVEKWVVALDKLNISYDINVYNDGSKDQTLAALNSAAQKFPTLKVNDKKNSGHGPTILLGYKNSTNYQWIFQIDSDDELGPEKFAELWADRANYDFLIGQRDGRFSPLPRKIISLISRWVVWVFYGTGVWDVNSPYRLMRAEKFKPVYNEIPADTFAPNVIITGMACKKKMRIKEIQVPYKDRQTGEVSIKKWKLFKAAVKSFRQTIKAAF